MSDVKIEYPANFTLLNRRPFCLGLSMLTGSLAPKDRMETIQIGSVLIELAIYIFEDHGRFLICYQRRLDISKMPELGRNWDDYSSI